METASSSELLTLSAVADALDTSVPIVRKWIVAGQLRTVERDGRALVARRDLHQFQAEQTAAYEVWYEAEVDRHIKAKEHSSNASAIRRASFMPFGGIFAGLCMACIGLVESIVHAVREIRGTLPDPYPQPPPSGAAPIEGTDPRDPLYGQPRPFGRQAQTRRPPRMRQRRGL